MASNKHSKIPSEVFWREQIAAQRNSDLSIREFCSRRGLAVSTFSYWKRKLGERGGASSSLVPVKVVGRAREGDDDGDSVIEVGLSGGRVVRVRPGFDTATLLRVVEAMESMEVMEAMEG